MSPAHLRVYLLIGVSAFLVALAGATVGSAFRNSGTCAPSAPVRITVTVPESAPPAPSHAS